MYEKFENENNDEAKDDEAIVEVGGEVAESFQQNESLDAKVRFYN